MKMLVEKETKTEPHKIFLRGRCLVDALAVACGCSDPTRQIICSYTRTHAYTGACGNSYFCFVLQTAPPNCGRSRCVCVCRNYST